MTTIDGSQLNNVTIDGEQVTEITIDGDIVWTAIVATESFEDGNANGWTLDSGWSVENNDATDGSWSLEANNAKANNAIWDSGLPTSQARTVTMDVYIGREDSFSVQFRGSGNNTNCYVGMENDDLVVRTGISLYTSVVNNILTNEWYTLKWENIDYSTDTYDFSVIKNGSTIGSETNINFYDSNASEINNMQFRETLDAAPSSRVDNIVVDR